jgi:hypothetical protein
MFHQDPSQHKHTAQESNAVLRLSVTSAKWVENTPNPRRLALFVRPQVCESCAKNSGSLVRQVTDHSRCGSGALSLQNSSALTKWWEGIGSGRKVFCVTGLERRRQGQVSPKSRELPRRNSACTVSYTLEPLERKHMRCRLIQPQILINYSCSLYLYKNQHGWS